MEGINNVLGRIQQIESHINSMTGEVPAADFSAVMQQADAGGLNKFLPPDSPFANPAAAQNGLWNVGTQSATPIANVTGDTIAAKAAAMEGRQYWSNACAHAVNDVLKDLGVDIKDKVNNNPEWVPNYANLGTKLNSIADMKPGDLVIYNNEIGQGGYDHIGIYAGNGEAYNVSTAAGHKWVKTPIGSRFQEGHRITG